MQYNQIIIYASRFKINIQTVHLNTKYFQQKPVHHGQFLTSLKKKLFIYSINPENILTSTMFIDTRIFEILNLTLL